MSKHLTISIFIILLICLILPQVTFAALVPCGRHEDDLTTPTDETQPCNLCHLFLLLQILLNGVTISLFVWAAIMIVIGGITIITSAGIPEKVSKGKRTITYTILGVLIALSAWVIINEVMLTFVGPGTGQGAQKLPWPWKEISCVPSAPPAEAPPPVTPPVTANLTITTASLSNGKTGETYSQKLEASGGKTPYSWSIKSGNLPSGLALDSAGNISGKPTTAGEYSFTIQVTDTSSPQQTDSKNFAITSGGNTGACCVSSTCSIRTSSDCAAANGTYEGNGTSCAPDPCGGAVVSLTITTASLSNGKTGETYSQKLEASGGKTPYSWKIESGALPHGLTLSSDGNISGKPTTAEEYSFTIQVTDTSSPQQTNSKNFAITISSPNCVAVYGDGPRGIEFIAKTGQVSSDEAVCVSKWDPTEIENESDSWVLAVAGFESVLYFFPPFSTQDFTIYRSNDPDQSVCPNTIEKVYLFDCPAPYAWSVNGAHTVFISTFHSVGVLVHELGHSFADLCDEYIELSASPQSDCVNCCTHCEKEKCHPSWPTTTCYLGCNYRESGWFRDAPDDVMNGCYSIGCSFGPVDTAIINQYLGK